MAGGWNWRNRRIRDTSLVGAYPMLDRPWSTRIAVALLCAPAEVGVRVSEMRRNEHLFAGAQERTLRRFVSSQANQE